MIRNKGCLVFRNFLLNPNTRQLAINVCDVNFQVFENKIVPVDIKACHTLPSTGNVVTIIKKFAYFSQKVIYIIAEQIGGRNLMKKVFSFMSV